VGAASDWRCTIIIITIQINLVVLCVQAKDADSEEVLRAFVALFPSVLFLGLFSSIAVIQELYVGGC
jgi:hypothetical protein